jgi:hypothetical protein
MTMRLIFIAILLGTLLLGAAAEELGKWWKGEEES